ncbi:MAG: glycogen synthase GlgA [Ignavibacteriae bacterium]|nr:glycogen synthase GlgA [Ignavibacteriota bacterium]
MKVALVSSEVAPFAKTGGLADVAGALPKALKQTGCDIKVFMPKYSTIDESKFELHYEYSIGEMPVRVGGIPRPVHIQQSTLPGSTVDIYFIDCPHFFDRGKIYTADWDEDERFILFNKAVIETLQRLQWSPDVVHCNDWPTALIPLLLKDNYNWDSMFGKTASIMSIHNIGYQGLFPLETLSRAELRPELFYPGGPLEFNGAVCFLKAGILFSEIISTVSETYAKEILTPEYGAGMDAVLGSREADLSGVLNGIDVDEWNPQTDKHLPHKYSMKNMEGKNKNKEYLLEHTGLQSRNDVPLIGIISRMVAQKGFDLIAESVHELMGMDAQWIILGTGEERFENLFRAIGQSLSHKAWAYIGFNNDLAHLIEGGADMFLMPSLYEPCGLNQMYSLRYGTVPIARKTGGLADTVQDWHEYLSQGSEVGDGFSFNDATGFALSSTVRRAIETFKDKKVWQKIQANGMQRDFSWTASAKKYVTLYENAMAKRHA